MSTLTCPTRVELQALLNGSMPDSEAGRTTDHIGTCTTCQQTLDSIATGEIPIESLVTGIDPDGPLQDSAYWKAIESVKAEHVPVKSDASSVDIRTDVTQDLSVAPTPSQSSPASASSKSTTNLPPVAIDHRLSFLAPSDDPAYIGRLGHFEIARVIGSGGMGIVLEGFDTHLRRNVAIKVLRQEVAKNEVARQRFCREGRAAAAIAHEHVVAMHQVVRQEQDEIAYLVMQLIEGETLESRLRDGQPLPPAETARIGMQMAAGLSAAHARGMVHRDIKPANILIEAETNRVKLTDFGLARATDDVKLTKTGMVAGTPLYMSPEQATGAAADERSDMFSLGAVLYEMATGKSPFAAPSIVGVMKRIMDETPEPPHKVNPAVPRVLSDITMALLDKRPERRPESTAQVASALAGVVNQFGPISPLQVPAVGVADAKTLSGNHRRLGNPKTLGIWAAAAVTLLMIGGLLGYSLSGSLPGERTSELSGPAASTSPKPDGPSFPVVVLSGNPGTVWSVDFAPDRKHIAAAIGDGSVRLWNVENQELVKSFNAHRGIVWMVRYHPTRPIVATSGDDGFVKLWDRETFEPISQWRATNAVRNIAFSPNGERLVAGDRDGKITVLDIDKGEPVVQVTQPGSIFGVDYSADGNLIATVGSDKIVRIWDAENLSERQTMAGHPGPIYNVAFAPTGSTLATVGWGKSVILWNTETGTEKQTLTGSEGDVWSAGFCTTGGHLVTASQDSTAKIWDLKSGKIIATLAGHESAVHNASIDSANQRVATSGRDGTIRIWDLSSLQP
ncbi:WD40 repeat domain-containing serine/threonine protein kinase [Stieleria varia]|uniref:non-specific serine/threonine protein kinase n=1 Tax=Stieleria varia TaxID=2528005 RepID=A0A5C6AH92_9BACT|nr:serine/threonine-protein kinase [Stieleria varia]TWT98668.1 Serine/threonine-protein kinase PrkC [Stieleria varia]